MKKKEELQAEFDRTVADTQHGLRLAILRPQYNLQKEER
jgi:hypothetical protein